MLTGSQLRIRATDWHKFFNLTADDLKTTIFAYPTGASDIGYML
jgi:hypothetical protein